MGRKAAEQVPSETKACPKKVGVILSPKGCFHDKDGGVSTGCTIRGATDDLGEVFAEAEH